LDQVTGQPAKATLNGRGGLRASVITGGALRVGDSVLVQPATWSGDQEAAAGGG